MASKFDRLAKTSGRVNKEAVSTAALACKGIALGEMVATGVTPGKKLKVGGAVNVRYDVKGTENASALVRMVGPAQLVNNPTKPHPIAPRTRSRRRKGSARALKLANGDFVAGVNHPGTAGKHFWEKAEHKMRVTAPRVVQATHRGAWAREF